MKMLKNIDFKAIFFDHFEKLLLSLIVLFVMLSLSMTIWSPYPGSPDDLKEMVDSARKRINSVDKNPWPKQNMDAFEVIDFRNRAEQLFSRMDESKFQLSIPIYQPLIRKRELAREPEFLPVESLIADAGFAILGILDEDPDDAAAKQSSDSSNKVSEAGDENQFKPQRGKINTAKPAGGNSKAPKPPRGNVLLDEDEDENDLGSNINISARSVAYVAIRGVFPLKQQIEKYKKALNFSKSSQADAVFDVLDFVLERQVAVTGPNPWSETWETVNCESALEVLKEAANFEPDPVQTGVTDSVITMSLPSRVLEFWGKHATHPSIREFELPKEEMERELELQQKLMEEYGKIKTQVVPKIQRRGLSSAQEDPREIGRQMIAQPGNNFNTAMNSDGKLKMDAETIRMRLTANGRLLLFRYFDFDVQPGFAYRYRVKLKVLNPNFERPSEDVVDPALVQGPERESEWSNVSMPAVVPNRVDYFLKSVERDPFRDDKARSNKPVAVFSFFERDSKLGTMIHENLRIVYAGQSISEIKKSVKIDAAKVTYVEEDVAFSTGDFLLDATGDYSVLPEYHSDLALQLQKGRRDVAIGLLSNAIVMNSSGAIREFDSAKVGNEEAKLEERLKRERDELKWVKELADSREKQKSALLEALLESKSEDSAEMIAKLKKKNPKKKTVKPLAD
ncbi:MAG: hypothetical protein NTW75_08345 [Planctomycetales bacterium]|nr:hypothetical protein [Planctomycetales bacterium]